MLAVPYATPISHRYLPSIEFPKPKHYGGFNHSLQHDSLVNIGVEPGLYSSCDSVEIFLPQVHDELVDTLRTELEEFDRFDLCRNLYDKLEINYGHLKGSDFDWPKGASSKANQTLR